MPELNLKVTPVFGDSKYSYAFIHDFLEGRIREEIKVCLLSFLTKSRMNILSVCWFFLQWMINYYHSCVIGY